MRSLIHALLPTLLALAVPPAIAQVGTLRVDNNAFGSITAGTTSVFFQHDLTEPFANVNSGTISGIDTFGRAYNGSAQAHVNSSNLGDLKLSGSATFTGAALLL